jgi:hypothetical protein
MLIPCLAKADSSEAAGRLFAEKQERQTFLKNVGMAMAQDVAPQVIAEAKLFYGLSNGDTDYLRQNLALFEKVARSLDASRTIKFKTVDEWNEKINFVKELAESPQPNTTTTPSGEDSKAELLRLQQQLEEKTRQLEQLQANANQAASQEYNVPIVSDDPSLGNPALRSQVTRESLGKVFIPGKGWLSVGPNGPIDAGQKQVVSRVRTHAEVRTRELAKAASAAGMTPAEYSNMLQRQQASRNLNSLTNEISRLNSQISALRKY